MIIFDFDDYKTFVKKWVKSQPQAGYGMFSAIAENLSISSVLVSQIFNGDKNLSLEHAILLTEFLGLVGNQKDYFLLLVNYKKAGSQKLEHYFLRQIEQVQKEYRENLNFSLRKDIVLQEEDKAIFYSNWTYSAVRLLSSVRGFHDVDTISRKLGISKEQVSDVLKFLVSKGLCVQTQKGFEMGPQRTHLEATSPYIKTRQVSWRVKSMEKMDMKNTADLYYTAPMSISKNQYKELKKKISELIQDFTSNLITEDPEQLACLCIDLFEV